MKIAPGHELCSRCKHEPRRATRNGYIHSWCRRCLAKDTQARRKRDPIGMRAIGKRSAQRKIKEIVDRVRKLKARPCTDCRRRLPHYVMQYDHRDSTSKIAAVATLCRNTRSWERVESEIAKCDLVCTNCHAERTWNRKEARRVR